jgi:hypothetical protein
MSFFIRWATRGILGVAIGIGLAGCMTRGYRSEEDGLSIATFSCDVTPPVGHPLRAGWIKPLESVDDDRSGKDSKAAG